MTDTEMTIKKAIEKTMPKDIDLIGYRDELGNYNQIVVARGVNEYFDLALDLEDRLSKKATDILLDLAVRFEKELVNRCSNSGILAHYGTHIIAYVEPSELSLSPTGVDRYLKNMGFPARKQTEAPMFERHSYS